MFLKRLLKALKKILLLLMLLVIGFLVFVFNAKIFNHIVHAKAFYEVNIGDKEYHKGNFQEAIDHYKKALELYPGHVKARYNLANIYVTYEDFPNAINEYKTVLKNNPNYLNARISLGIVFAENQINFDEAIQQYEKAVKTKAKFINIPFLYDNRKQIIKAKSIAYYNMGLAYRDKSMLYTKDSANYRDMILKAIECYKSSLALNKNNYNAQYNFALSKHLLGLHTEALEGYCKSILIDPISYEAHYNLAVLLREKKKYEDSFEEFKNAGSLMNYIGDSSKAAFIYEMLNEVSQMAISENGYKSGELFKKLNEEGIRSNDMIKRLKTAGVCKNYLKNL